MGRYHRRMDIRNLLPAALLALAASVPASVRAATPDDGKPAGACVRMEQGWIRLPPAPRPMLAGFGRIANGCGRAQAVVAARSPVFAEVSIHETTVVDGVSRMRELEKLALPAGGEAVLQPGGLHLMLMQPRGAVAAGQRVPLVLVLEDGAEVAAELVVGAGAPGGRDGHQDHHHGH